MALHFNTQHCNERYRLKKILLFLCWLCMHCVASNIREVKFFPVWLISLKSWSAPVNNIDSILLRFRCYSCCCGGCCCCCRCFYRCTESWKRWRRTNFPQLPIASALLVCIDTRTPYPTNESERRPRVNESSMAIKQSVTC